VKLFQYWDSPEPPDDVAAWIDSVRTLNPDFEHQLFSRDGAAGFIQDQLGARALAAFQACAVPAMQADYFRLCALFACGGLWIDADTEALGPIRSLTDDAPRSLMLEWDEFLGTTVMMFRSPADPFAGAFLDLATRNIESRSFSSPVIATGPMLADALRALLDPAWAAVMAPRREEPLVQTRLGLIEHIRPLIRVTDELVAAYRAMTIRHTVSALERLRFGEPAYKKTPRHWANWKGSIYATPPDRTPA
jgi:hypothetical protein